ncbi:hypothetical protein FIU86_12730 [Roseovarius sp. THAF9]|nr:hypothetical protein FIU86_12730 [Roseovarius sp. THAF9]
MPYKTSKGISDLRYRFVLFLVLVVLCGTKFFYQSIGGGQSYSDWRDFMVYAATLAALIWVVFPWFAKFFANNRTRKHE